MQQRAGQAVAVQTVVSPQRAHAENLRLEGQDPH